jgi:hypothetical protein
MSLNQKVVAKALSDVGRVIERPLGSNDDGGGPITSMQAYWKIRYQPWCGCATSRWLRAVPGVTDVGHPSTWAIVQNAKRNGWVTNRPVPGALIVWPPEGGTHVEMVVEVLDGDRVATVGGNVSHRVQRKVRSLEGASLVVSPELRNGSAVQRAYYLEDPAVKPKLYGPWRTKAQREKVIAGLSPVARQAARRVRVKGRYAFTIGRRVYGPWLDKDGRDNARKVLERRLGRTLRPYSVVRKTTTTAAAEGLGETT